MSVDNEKNLKTLKKGTKTKKCSNCKRVLPATTIYFYRNKKAKYGLESKCKDCLRKYYTLRNKIKRYGISKNQFVPRPKVLWGF